MVLKIKGLGKIKDSEIEMKGITVIAGENSTGKSTFGKALYCMFNAFCDIDKMVLNERIIGIEKIFSTALLFDNFNSINLSNELFERILNLKKSFSADAFRDIVYGTTDKVSEFDYEKVEEIIRRSLNDIERYVNFSDLETKKTIVNRCFRTIFSNQVNHLNYPNNISEVSMKIHDKYVKVEIINNECSNLSDEVGIIHNAIYIDSPFVIDEIGRKKSDLNNINYRDYLIQLLKNDIEPAILTEAIVKQKLNNVYNILSVMANGKFTKAEKTLAFKDNSIQQHLALLNVSAGMKLFLIIKRLLEQNHIKEKDVLILDEPEIHLHPDWQIKFAEILILLQKEFNLTILMTTHSPYFLHAIEVYSEKYEVIDNTKFYLAKNNEDTSYVMDVTNDIEKVYKQLAAPFEKLDDIVYKDN